MLVVWLDEIPRELWWARPGLVLAHASLLFGEGRYEEAWEALEKALETLIERGEQQRAALAFLRLLRWRLPPARLSGALRPPLLRDDHVPSPRKGVTRSAGRLQLQALKPVD